MFVALRCVQLLSRHHIKQFRKTDAIAMDLKDTLKLKRDLSCYSQDTLRVKAVVLEADERLVYQHLDRKEAFWVCLADYNLLKG